MNIYSMGERDMKKLITYLLVYILISTTFTIILSSATAIDSIEGNSVIYTFRPTGDIVLEWVPGSGRGYTEVDDEIPDETKTYISTSFNGRKDLYFITPLAISEIKNVTVYGRFITDFIGSRFSVLIYEKSTSSIEYSTPIQLSGKGKWETTSHTWETNPFTGMGWNDSDVADLGIGILADYCDQGSAVFCTQVYAEVACSNLDPPDQDDSDNDTGDDDGGDDPTPETPPDEENPNNFMEKIEEMDLHKGLKKSLTSKLKNAVKSLDKNRLNAAENKIGAFINHVRAQNGKKLTYQKGIILIDISKGLIHNPNR